MEKQIADPGLEALFDEDRAEEPLFIKNLENVQGDERDIILISVGYGKNKDGKFFQRFGPINQAVGHRRLNVAFTRARRKIMVFCSFHSHEVKVKATASAGVRFLRDYLRFAETGHLEAPTLPTKSKSHTGIEEQLLQALQAKGYDVVPRLGSSKYRLDLAVRNPRDPKHFVLGIETDGEMYGLAQTARERDRLRADLLRLAGWQLERVWSRDWAKDPAAKVEALCQRIEALSLAHEEHVRLRREELEAARQLREFMLADTLLMVWQHGRWSVEKNGVQLHPPIFDRIDEHLFGENLFRVWSRRKVGLMNLEGTLLLEPINDLISTEALESGHYLFECQGKYGLINDRGFVLQEPHFDAIELDFSPEFALVEADGKHGILNKSSGQLLIPPEYDWVGEWQDDFAELGKDDLVFRLGEDGKLAEIAASVQE